MVEQSTPQYRKTLVLFGDSIVYGWGVRRDQRYSNALQRLVDADPVLRRWRIVAEGVPGDTSLQGLARFALDVTPHRPDAVLIAFGLNDGALNRSSIDVQRERIFLARTRPWWRAWLWWRKAARIARRVLKLRRRPSHPVSHEPEPRVRPRLFEAGLCAIVRGCEQLDAQPVLLALVPQDDRRLPDAQQQSYAVCDKAISTVSMSTDTALIRLDPPEPGAGHHADDGVHLTALGHRWLAEQIHAQLTQVLS